MSLGCRGREFYRQVHASKTAAMSVHVSRCLSPLGRLFMVMELRSMQRRLPNVHRGWVHTERGIHGILPETDAEHLERLRQRASERAMTAELHAVAEGYPRAH